MAANSSYKGKEKMIVVEDSNVASTSYTLGPYPPGYKFDPSDEELVLCYLRPKVNDEPLPPHIMHDIDLYDPQRLESSNPWQLSEFYQAQGEKEWYFFTPRDRKYPKGTRPNRAAGTGYWKASSKDAPIWYDGNVVGHKQALVFYDGRPPNGSKTNWIMHEFRLHYDTNYSPRPDQAQNPDRIKLDDWVLFRIHLHDKGGENKKRENEPKKQRKTPAKKPKCAPSTSSARVSVTPEYVNATSYNYDTYYNNIMTTTPVGPPPIMDYPSCGTYWSDTPIIPSISGGDGGQGGEQFFNSPMIGDTTTYGDWNPTLPVNYNNTTYTTTAAAAPSEVGISNEFMEIGDDFEIDIDAFLADAQQPTFLHYFDDQDFFDSLPSCMVDGMSNSIHTPNPPPSFKG